MMIVSFDTIMHQPPYQITSKTTNLIAEISEIIGKIKAEHLSNNSPELRKKNRIKTIHGSLAIEGNSLSIEQVSAVIDEQTVLGPIKDIKEVQNAIQAYKEIPNYKFNSIKSLLKAHKYLMHSLISDPGKIRTTNVGIMKGSKVTHVAPQPKMLDKLMTELFEYLKKSPDHLLIKSSVVHYELEFIHPFIDGNGRLGRLWQTVILYNYSEIFEFVPIESLIKLKQKQYYAVLESCDKEAHSTLFIEFMLEIILEALAETYSSTRPQDLNAQSRLIQAQQAFAGQWFSRKDYMAILRDISTATASRDLKQGLESKVLQKKGEARMVEYKFRCK
ncbi:MAG: Fic family protein [Cyanobacteria bacterium]|nr:Fic family protein [Cyanobacteriota bacterium]